MKTYLPTLSFILFSLLFVQCGVRIPAVDITPPVITFEITIPGEEGIRISSEEDFEFIQINLHENGRYAFRFTARDEGGVRLMHMQYDTHLRITGLASSLVDREISPLSRMIEWEGIRARPVSSMIASGMIHSEALIGTDQVAGAVRLFAADYGGRSGPGNETSMEIQISTVRAGEPIGIVARY